MNPHIFGFAGLFFIVIAWQFPQRRFILAFNTVAFILFSIELHILEEPVGSILMISAAVNAFIAIFITNKIFSIPFIVIPLIVSFSYMSKFIDLLPATAHITGSIAFFSKRTVNVRLLAPIGTILWAIYNAAVGAWGQLLADFFILTSMAIGAYRHRSQRQ